MEFTLDISFLELWIGKTPWWILARVIWYGGWVPLLFVIIWAIWRVRVYRLQGRYAASIEYVLLAIDVPKQNQQGPKAVEQLFAHLAGIKNPPNWIERNFKGEFQLGFSLEIISIDGYIQFLIRTPVQFRDLIEAAVYAQYPDAEITEVEDYTKRAPEQLPDEKYDLWGAEFKLDNKQVYPIRTYPSFEDPTAKERFKDPMASILEILSKLQKGEQVWLQILIVPAENDWKKQGETLVKQLVGEKLAPKKMVGEKAIEKMGEIAPAWWEVPVQKEVKPGMFLDTPGHRRVVEAIQNKISKIGFYTKIRFIYLAEKTVFNKLRGVVSVLGAFNQFNTLDMNGFKPDKFTKTKIGEFELKRKLPVKQNKILRNYKNRNDWAGTSRFILNTEELATIFHFPVFTVEAPMVKKTGSKRAEPPFTLPVEGEEELLPFKKEAPKKSGESPPELPTEE